MRGKYRRSSFDQSNVVFQYFVRKSVYSSVEYDDIHYKSWTEQYHEQNNEQNNEQNTEQNTEQNNEQNTEQNTEQNNEQNSDFIDHTDTSLALSISLLLQFSGRDIRRE